MSNGHAACFPNVSLPTNFKMILAELFELGINEICNGPGMRVGEDESRGIVGLPYRCRPHDLVFTGIHLEESTIQGAKGLLPCWYFEAPAVWTIATRIDHPPTLDVPCSFAQQVDDRAWMTTSPAGQPNESPQYRLGILAGPAAVKHLHSNGTVVPAPDLHRCKVSHSGFELVLIEHASGPGPTGQTLAMLERPPHEVRYGALYTGQFDDANGVKRTKRVRIVFTLKLGAGFPAVNQAQG
ncbi:hypothetical protein JCM11491_000698 [Sporobolomyces phaffii]